MVVDEREMNTSMIRKEDVGFTSNWPTLSKQIDLLSTDPTPDNPKTSWLIS